MLEIKHLKTVHALTSGGSLASAANILHTTQSALSHQIKELEHRLAQPIYIRKSKPLKLTQAGEQILKLAEQTLPAFQQTESLLKRWSQGDGGRLHMAIECHSCFQWLFPALDEYRQHWPNVEVDFASGFHFDALQALRDDELDLVITSDPIEHSELEYIPLFEYQNLLLLEVDHPLAGHKAIQAKDLTDCTLITYPVEQHRLSIYKDLLTPAGCSPTSVRQTELTLMMVQLVLSGRGVASLPEWVIAEYEHKASLVSRPFEPQLWSTLYAAVQKRESQTEYIAAFTKMARISSFSKLKNIKPV